jgi:adenylylsulfate kinase-like enzyme
LPPLVVVVTGPPASGKSSVAQALARELRLPLLAKDTIKESLFDSLGWGGRDRSKELGRASILLLLTLVERLAAAGTSLVVESNFETASTERLAQLEARILQVYCTAPAEVLVARFADRDRHPGHEDELYDLELALEQGRWPPLALPGRFVELDMSSEPDLGPILELAR